MLPYRTMSVCDLALVPFHAGGLYASSGAGSNHGNNGITELWSLSSEDRDRWLAVAVS